MARTPSRSPTPTRGRRSRSLTRSPLSRSRSPFSRSRTRSGSRHSRSRSPNSRSRSRSRSRSQSVSDKAKSSACAWDEEVLDYGDFVPADEESPTFFLSDATVQLVRDKVYQAAPLGKKHYNDLKQSRYILKRSTHESLEPKPVPPQAVSSMNGMDFNNLHGKLLTLHNVSRVAQRPIWSSMETVQKTRGNLKKIAPLNFISPPHLTSTTSPLPDGHVDLDYPEEERLRHMAKCPQNPSQQEIEEMHESNGVYKKFFEQAGKSMQSMISALQEQQGHFSNVKSALDDVWSRYQDYINMARYLETHVKEMRRTQLVKAHTRDFANWLENIHLKDKERMGARDRSDEILAENYDNVLRAYQEFKKNKNTALKSSYQKRSAASNSDNRRDSYGASGSGSSHQKDSRQPQSDNRRESRQDGKQRKHNNKGNNKQPNRKTKSSRNSGPPPKDGKDKTA